MKLATILLALVAVAPTSRADDAGPVVPITPAVTVWTIAPVSVHLISVLASPAAAPEQIRALVAAMTPDQIVSVVLAIQNNTSSLSALIAAMTPAQTASVVIALQNIPDRSPQSPTP